MLKKYAMEAIGFQSDMLFRELTATITELRAGQINERTINDSPLIALIKKRTGMTVVFDEYKTLNAYCMIPAVSAQNPIIRKTVAAIVGEKDTLKAIAKAGGVARGFVDDVNGKVSGFLSEITLHVAVGNPILDGSKGFSAEETAGILLHELGHGFTFLSCIADGIGSNYAIGRAIEECISTEDRKRRIAVIDAAATATGTEITDPATLAETASREGFEVVFANALRTRKRSRYGSPLYDLISAEQLADQFAARHGAGRAVVTGLDRLNRRFGVKSLQNTSTWVMSESVRSLFQIFTLVSGTIASPVLGGIALAVFGLTFVFMNPYEDSYDRPVDRFVRIRNDLVAALKDTGLSPLARKTIEADIATIDGVTQVYKDRDSFYQTVWRWFHPKGAQQVQQKQLLKQVEELLSNDLFLKASQLQTLAG